ncbi:hypothetical protein FSP39_002527 [Pinctada imbricata]|uniref:CB1 cannabinoid receptor-interacting protein 1 n=1 Tax=Pinctada imbricata TaxID=66713 RepID=A0AA88XV32_PINIB|nr:hypothetical protein FSP39_002527 [Pinctada imbricata]
MGVFMRAEVQCKFYNEGEQDHSKWGTPLTSVDYDCRVEEGGIHVDIVKEKYL